MEELPERDASGVGQGLNVRPGLLAVDEVGELDGVLDEEDWGVVKVNKL